MVTLSKQQIVAMSWKIGFLILPVLSLQILNGFYLSTIAHVPWLFWANDLVTYMVLPFIAYVGLIKLGVRPQQYGFKKPGLLYDGATLFFHALLLFFSAWVIWGIVFPIIYHLLPATPSFLYRQVIPENGGMRLLVVTYFAAAAGIVESALYLGVFKLLIDIRYAERLGKIIFLIVSPCVFALAHWEQGWPGLISAWLNQLIFCFAYLRLGYLPPFILAHTAIDYILFF